MFWAGRCESVACGWREEGKQWYIVFPIGGLKGLEDVDIIEVVTFAGFFSRVDGEIVDGGFDMWWFFDVCRFPLHTEEG